MKQNTIIIFTIVAVIAAGIGFFGGMKYQQSKRSSTFSQFRNGNTANSGAVLRGGFRPVSGDIIKADDTSITVKLSDGSTKIVLLTKDTQINKAEQGSKTDLTTGIQVAVFGSENSDGSVTAQNVQLNPQLDMRRVPKESPMPTK